jgi:hypothetical protein
MAILACTKAADSKVIAEPPASRLISESVVLRSALRTSRLEILRPTTRLYGLQPTREAGRVYA